MLASQDLGRRHKRRLIPVFYNGVAYRRGDRGFTRANVALYKAVHRSDLCLDIRHAIGYCAVLSVCQLKRQIGRELLGIIVFDFNRADSPAVGAEVFHPEVEHNKLLGNKALAG